jgi:hypothetical protein
LAANIIPSVIKRVMPGAQWVDWPKPACSTEPTKTELACQEIEQALAPYVFTSELIQLSTKEVLDRAGLSGHPDWLRRAAVELYLRQHPEWQRTGRSLVKYPPPHRKN